MRIRPKAHRHALIHAKLGVICALLVLWLAFRAPWHPGEPMPVDVPPESATGPSACA